MVVLDWGLPAASPVHSQANGQATVTVLHHYTLNFSGFGVLNDCVTYCIPGTSAAQIPSVQLARPDVILSRAAGRTFVPSGGQQFTETRSESNGTTTFTITSSQPTLQPKASSSVRLEAYVKDIRNSTPSAQ